MKEIKDIVQDTLGPERATQEVKEGTFFASKLVKMSAKQYSYLSSNIQPYQTTMEQIIGSSVAEGVLKNVDQELGGFIDFIDGYKIAFSIDGFKSYKDKNLFIEHKFLFMDSLDEWKFRSAIMQCAFYAALAYEAKNLRTSNFRVEQGFPKKEVKVNTKLPCEVVAMITMPRKIYTYNLTLDAKFRKKVIDFYKDKAKAIISAVKDYDWDAAREWDEEYKKREQDIFFSDIKEEDLDVVYEREINF